MWNVDDQVHEYIIYRKAYLYVFISIGKPYVYILFNSNKNSHIPKVRFEGSKTSKK